MQIVHISGTVTRDSERRSTQSGKDLVSFPVAVSNGKDKDGNWRDSTFWDCTIWGARATDGVAGLLRKGLKVSVYGRPTVRVHDGKAYLGIDVNDFTPQGGGENTPREERQEPQGRGPSYDDDIPFSPEWRI